MFEHSIQKKSVHSAANMLKILQHLEGIDQVLLYSYEVLKLALSQLEFELSHDIIRFIRLIEEEKRAEELENGQSDLTPSSIDDFDVFKENLALNSIVSTTRTITQHFYP